MKNVQLAKSLVKQWCITNGIVNSPKSPYPIRFTKGTKSPSLVNGKILAGYRWVMANIKDKKPSLKRNNVLENINQESSKCGQNVKWTPDALFSFNSKDLPVELKNMIEVLNAKLLKLFEYKSTLTIVEILLGLYRLYGDILTIDELRDKLSPLVLADFIVEIGFDGYGLK